MGGVYGSGRFVSYNYACRSEFRQREFPPKNVNTVRGLSNCVQYIDSKCIIMYITIFTMFFIQCIISNFKYLLEIETFCDTVLAESSEAYLEESADL